MDNKILCVCGKGNVRSVATKYCLNRRGYNDVIAIGSRLISDKTLKMLCEWADIVLVAKPHHGDLLPGSAKIDKRFSIGNDYWGNPVNLRLEEIINEQLDKIGLI